MYVGRIKEKVWINLIWNNEVSNEITLDCWSDAEPERVSLGNQAGLTSGT